MGVAAIDHGPGRRAVIGGRPYPILLPSLSDPRLHLALVITTVQVLGQTALDFELSIAQILISLATSAVVEFVILFATRRVIAWPASALLAGNGVALLLRVEGTEHGQWWSLRGAHIFMATAAVAVVSKHVVRWRGRPLFNPSNVALVSCFLLLGSSRVNPLDFWWGPRAAGIVAVYVVILIGGLVITTRVAMLGAAAAFWLTFAAGTGILAERGHCFTARWHIGPVCNGSFWTTLVTSPEVLIFALFMITDPKTAPLGRVGRVAHGMSIGYVATLLIATQTTEFGVKVAVLGALVIVCALRPLLEFVTPAPATADDHTIKWLTSRSIGRPIVLATVVLTTVAGAAVLAALPHARSDRAVAAETFVLVDATDRDVDVPPVTIAVESRRLDVDIDDARAHTMAVDLVVALRAVADAAAAREPRLAASFVTPRALEQLEQLVATAGDAPISNYRFDRMTVLVMREGRNSQAVPKLAIRAEGTTENGDTAADRIYAMAEVNGRFLIDGQFDTESVVLD